MIEWIRFNVETMKKNQKKSNKNLRTIVFVFFVSTVLAMAMFFVVSSQKTKNLFTTITGDGSGLLSEKIKQSEDFLENLGGQEGSGYVEGELIVKFKEGETELKKGFFEKLQTTILGKEDEVIELERVTEKGISLFEISEDEKVRGVSEEMVNQMTRLEKNENVLYVQPNFVYKRRNSESDSMVNSAEKLSLVNVGDERFDLQWGAHNVGQEIVDEYGKVKKGKVDADVDALEAWGISDGSENEVIVAVIDSGVAYNHPDLKDNMWDGSECVDWMGDQLGDCVHGYNLFFDNKNPYPEDGDMHGTHVAGIIAARDNDLGIVGVAPNAKIMALGSKQHITTIELVKGIDFAKKNGAKIINASWGGGTVSCEGIFDKLLYEGIKSFPGLFVASSGNGDENGKPVEHDLENFFDSPSDYGVTTSCWEGLDNVISVAATNQNDELWESSDYGKKSIHIGAPGKAIVSSVSEVNIINKGTVAKDVFSNVTVPNFPVGWEGEGSFATILGEDSVTKKEFIYLAVDKNIPYESSGDSSLTSEVFNLGEGNNNSVFELSFLTVCDTELLNPSISKSGSWAETDYVALEVSVDGGGKFQEIKRFNEGSFLEGRDGNENISLVRPSEIKAIIPSTNSFRFRLRWRSDDDKEFGTNGNGCYFYDFKIKEKEIKEVGHFLQAQSGTSMAAPYVSGLAALLWGYNPNLTTSEVKDIILTSGDSIPALEGKTITGKRINAHNAVESVVSKSATVNINNSSSAGAEENISLVENNFSEKENPSTLSELGGSSSEEEDTKSIVAFVVFLVLLCFSVATGIMVLLLHKKKRAM